MKIFGVTGGSGAGKSSVIEIWRSLGAHILDCDEIYHELIKSNRRLLWEIQDAFPGVVAEGGIDRHRLGEIVFSDHMMLEKLNGIAHKFVLEDVRAALSEARRNGVDVVAVEALYLLETDLASMCDIVVGVIAPVWKRVRRVMERDKIDDGHAWARLRAQKDDEYFLQNCDIVIENNGTSDQLREKARDVYLNNR